MKKDSIIEINYDVVCMKVVFILFTLSLISCGGGGSSNDPVIQQNNNESDNSLINTNTTADDIVEAISSSNFVENRFGA